VEYAVGQPVAWVSAGRIVAERDENPVERGLVFGRTAGGEESAHRVDRLGELRRGLRDPGCRSPWRVAGGVGEDALQSLGS
jgi:hypothetical protein